MFGLGEQFCWTKDAGHNGVTQFSFMSICFELKVISGTGCHTGTSPCFGFFGLISFDRLFF